MTTSNSGIVKEPSADHVLYYRRILTNPCSLYRPHAMNRDAGLGIFRAGRSRGPTHNVARELPPKLEISPTSLAPCARPARTRTYRAAVYRVGQFDARSESADS